MLVIVSVIALLQNPNKLAAFFCHGLKAIFMLLLLGQMGLVGCSDIKQAKQRRISSTADTVIDVNGNIHHLPVNDHDRHANDQQTTSPDVVTITRNRVTLTAEHIQNFKPERYQPHLMLYGRLLPKSQQMLTAQAGWQIQDVFVKPDQWVKKGDVLLSYQVRKQNSLAISPNVHNPNAHKMKAVNSPLTDDNILQSENTKDINKPETINHHIEQAQTNHDTAKSDLIKNLAQEQTLEPVNLDNHLLNNQQLDNQQLDNEKPISTEHNYLTSNNTKQHIIDEINELHHTPPTNRSFVVGRPPETAPAKQNTLKQVTDNAVVSELRAPYAGQVMHSYLPYLDRFMPLRSGQPLLKISDTREFHFISILPEYTRSQISVGQVVNFSPQNTKIPVKMTGQIAKITPIANNKLAVTITVIEDDKSRPYLKEGLWVQGKVDYGQIEIGTLVAKSAVIGADLSAFLQPHAHIAAPIKAYVWVINQDLTLTRQPVMVVRYDAQTQQYLVSGIPPETLICLANLPQSAEGKVARVVGL